MRVKVALVDDNLVNRNTFLRKVQGFEDLEITFVAATGAECLEQLKELPLESRPQVLFVDLEMPGLNGIQVIQIAGALYPDLRFIVLTVFDDDERIFEAIKAGAGGYLLKDEDALSLRGAVTNALEQGGAPMSPSIARKALDLLSKAAIPATEGEEGQDGGRKGTTGPPSLEGLLSEREREILQYTIRGYEPKQIAEVLFISIYTVRKHISNIYEKLHVTSYNQIITLARKNRWI